MGLGNLATSSVPHSFNRRSIDMATVQKSAEKAKNLPAATPAKRNPDAFEVVKSEDTTSQALAKLATTSVLSAVTLKRYSGGGDALEMPDLVTEMRKAGDEVVAGNMGREIGRAHV